MTQVRRITVLAAVLIALGGCATIRRHETLDTEQALSAAGFQMKLADTPEKLADLRAHLARRLIPQERERRLYYVYADPEVCHCLYVGTEAQYQEYQRLALRKQLADEESITAQNQLDATSNWGLW